MTAARVRVERVRSGRGGSGERSEPQEGGPTARLGRGLCPRLYSLLTTTTVTLVLVCSSNRRESNVNVTQRLGVSA
jgi:hypothetical protein